MRIFAVEFLCDRLIYRNRKYEFIVILTHLNLIEQPLMLLEYARLQLLRSELVQTQHNLLIVVVLIEVVRIQTCLLLGSNHFLHKLHCRIVLPAILGRAFRTHSDLAQLSVVGLQFNHKMIWGAGRDF